MFNVLYRDDDKRLHIVIVNNIAELLFVKERFEIVSYEPIEAVLYDE